VPPLVPFFLAYVGGVLAALPASRDFLFPFALPVALALAALWMTRRQTPARRLIVLLFLPLGALLPGVSGGDGPANHVLHHLNDGARATVEGRLYEPPRVFPDRVRFTVELSSLDYDGKRQEVSGRARITLYLLDTPAETVRQLAETTLPQAGDRVRFDRMRLRRPKNFNNPGGFDYRRFLENRGIRVTGSLSRAEGVHRLGAFPLPPLARAEARLQEGMNAVLNRLFPGEDGALLGAMLLGAKERLTPDTREIYIATGLAHLTAVSGLHIGFVAGAAFFLLEPLVFYLLLRLRPDAARAGQARRIAAFLCFFPVMFYLLLAAGQISAVRASIMAGAVLIAIITHRERHLAGALLAAAFAILLVRPGAILDVSFQLSFAAVASILLALHLLKDGQKDHIARMGDAGWARRLLLGLTREAPEGGPLPLAARLKTRALQLFLGAAFISFVVFVGTLPFIVYHFNRLSLAGLLLNPLMVPLASFLIPFALFTLSAAMVFPPLGPLFAPLLAGPLQVFQMIPAWFAQLPFASVRVATPSPLWGVLYYAALLGGAWLLLNKRPAHGDEKPRPRPSPAWAGVLAGILFLGLFVPRLPAFGPAPLSITVLDVGQGESIYIEFPNRETMLIDGGGFYKNLLDIGNIVLAPFLWDRGLTRLDYLSVTHSDNDHIRGLESLLDIFPVGHFLDAFSGLPDRRIERLRQKARKQATVLTPLEVGQPLHIGEVDLLPLHPGEEFARQAAPDAKGGRIGNDLSLVLRIDYKDFSMLLTGDIGAEAEAHLIRQGAPLRADVLKGPHHGSRHSSHPAFIQAVAPQAVIFSSRDKSPWRHPHPEVIERYESAGAEVWRTDINGAVNIVTDGHGLDIQGTVPR